MRAATIEKTRREPASFPPTVEPPRGVLQPTEPRNGAFFHERLAVPHELAPFAHHFWYVHWDAGSATPGRAETFPHPSCYLIFEHDLERPIDDPCVLRGAEVAGVTTGKFSRAMAGHGRVFGLKFTSGGLRPFLKTGVFALTDRVVAAQEIFGSDVLTLAMQIRRLDDATAMAARLADFLAQRLPAPDPDALLATRLVDTILHDAAIGTVEALASESGLGIRALQRLFKSYVGVSPKWVIRRFRLHELLFRLNSGGPFDGAQIALDLGYADQAHLINDFRKLAGCAPTEYLRRVARLKNCRS